MRHLLLFILLGCISFTGFTQIPQAYYDPAAGLNGQPLLVALHGIIDDHTAVDYDDLYFYFSGTDRKPDNSIWDIYSDNPSGAQPYVYYFNSGDECGNYSNEGDCYNREHSWPKSWFGGEIMPMHSDLFHLYPTDGYVNNRRGNYPYGEVATATWTSLNGSRLGNCSWPGFSGIVFEPIDEYKGDLARTYFYMSARYFGQDAGWPGSDQATGAQLKQWALSMMLAWDQQDPVSQKETDRNDAVYLIQQNRNPFIDHPEYSQLIWGPAGVKAEDKPAATLTVIPNPASGQVTLNTGNRSLPDNTRLTLSSVTGAVLKEYTAGGSTPIKLDAAGLVPGLYFISLSHPDLATPVTGKLIVE